MRVSVYIYMCVRRCPVIYIFHQVEIVANFSSSDPFLQQLRTLNRNTFDSNMMSVQSDCPHRERFGYGGDPLGALLPHMQYLSWTPLVYRWGVRVECRTYDTDS